MDYRKTATILTATAGVSYLTYRAICHDMLSKIFDRKDNDQFVEQKYLDWISASNAVQVKVNSFDGLKLNAFHIRNHDDERYMIMVHGIASSKSSLYSRAYEFDQMGYNLLLIDQRNAGESEGDHYTYGIKEAQDLQIWINYLVSKHPDCSICLYGISMGAATVMMSTAYELAENVKCIVEESGYASLEEEFAYLIRKDYKIRVTYPVVKLIDMKMNEKYGMKLSDVSPKTCLENNEIPILLIHSEADETVPFENAKILYNHNKGVKKYYPIKDTAHYRANEDPDYYRNIDGFIRDYM
ncbi:MAG: alpha/beta hydrolase [Erysipelotrichaceae bacterium]|nr:alpha/beta hydrolase [Erysipelotrichaceae bacterium]